MTAPIGRRRNRYATKVGGPHHAPSVTTVLGVIAKPALSWGAAKETALFAVLHRSEWEDLSEAEAVERLRKHHRGIWDDKALRGTMVHSLATEWAQGAAVDVPPECVPYIDALEAFYVDWRPSWVQVERTVVHDDETVGYGGTFDAIADLADGKRWLLDIKTGSAIYPEVALQLAAYRGADAMAVFDDKGNLVDTEPLPIVDHCGVIHLQGNGSYSLIPVRAGTEEWQVFLHCRALWTHETTGAKTVLSEPVEAPKVEVPA